MRRVNQNDDEDEENESACVWSRESRAKEQESNTMVTMDTLQQLVAIRSRGKKSFA